MGSGRKLGHLWSLGIDVGTHMALLLAASSSHALAVTVLLLTLAWEQ